MIVIHAVLIPVLLFVSSLAVSTKCGHITPHRACNEIAAHLPGRISFPNGAAYNASQDSYYITEERELTPNCVFRPTTAAEVFIFVRLAAALCTKFAIRAGGHMLFSGAANIDEGNTVDMRGFNSVVVRSDRNSAAVGGGTIWSDVYPHLVPYNLTALGGRLPGMGIGGFTSGGGKSHLSRKYGWSCDNVFGYEIVLASGEIVYASHSQHRDLWLALKGGSNNFGIITRFDVATYPMGLMWGGVILYNYTPAVLESHAKAFSSYMHADNFDPLADAGMLFNFQNPGKVFSTLASQWYSADESFPSVFSNFTSIPSPANTLALRNVADQVTAFGALLPARLERVFELTYTLKNPPAAVYSHLIRLWEDGMEPLADVQGMIVQLFLQPLRVTNGTNSLGLVAGRKDLVVVELTAGWDKASDSVRARRQIQRIFDSHVKVLKKEGVFDEWQYLNYADILQDPIGSYGKEKVKALRTASRKYDPAGLFQKGVPGGFKLF